jgi:hypothetical protein
MTTIQVTNAPVEFDPPVVNPAPQGLYPVVNWSETKNGPSRFLIAGARVRTINYGGEDVSGVWDAPWCGDPTDPDAEKGGTRPPFPDPFEPTTVWAFDQCDLTAQSQAEVRRNAAQWLRLQEQTAIEREFAARLLLDAGAADPAADLTEAVGMLEAAFAVSNTLGFIHASAALAAPAESARLILRSGSTLKTPLGHTWVFGGGYVEGLDTTLVATSQVFGWRDSVEVREAIEHKYNQFVAIAERSVLVGYEALIGAAEVTP